MKKTWFKTAMLGLVLSVAFLSSMGVAQQVMNPDPGILASPVNSQTAVRFSRHVPLENHWVFPLVFRVATKGKMQMKTAPVLTAGRTVYIPLSEMKNLIQAIVRFVPMPAETRHHETFSSWQLFYLSKNMDVEIIYSRGAALGRIWHTNICQVLARLNQSIHTPRPRWEFQEFRAYQGCLVPGFDSDKYLDQWNSNR